MLTLSSIEPEMNGFGWYRAVTREFFHAKTAYFCQLNARKRIPFHSGCLITSDLGKFACGDEVVSLWNSY